MASPTFSNRLRTIQQAKQSVLCVGLDPDPARLPKRLARTYTLQEAVVAFNTAIIQATAPYACAFKLNFAFYEALGRHSWEVLEAAIEQIPEDTLIIADAKRGDIGNSARFYAEAVFSGLQCDACTVAPYMGRDAVEPFLQFEGNAAFVLGRTSNPGARDFQERICDSEPLYRHVARCVAAWAAEAPGDGGLVVGATSPEALQEIRALCPTLPFLIPGVGAQGGDPQQVMAAAATPDGPVLVNSSRQILYASAEDDFAEAAGQAADSLRRQLRST